MNLCEAPDRGIMYALYTDKVIYEAYRKEQLPSEDELMNNLLELHLFDREKEYRYIKMRNGEVEICVTDETIPHDDAYIERIYTTESKTMSAHGQIEVINYICYDENDLMKISDYRLKEVEI